MTAPFTYPRFIGHRGSAGTTPENTLLSFREAYEGGATTVEFDVVLTKDKIPVVFHDTKLDRTTNGKGPVADKTLAQLKALDAGSWMLPQFAGEPIATLAETLLLCRDLKLQLNIEIKPTPGQEQETTELALDLTDSLWPNDLPPPLISSFQPACLETARDLKPAWPRGCLFRNPQPESWRQAVEAVAASTININADISQGLLKEVIVSRKPVFVYTVNAVKQAEILFKLGVAGVFTDYPSQMIAGFGPLRAPKSRPRRIT